MRKKKLAAAVPVTIDASGNARPGGVSVPNGGTVTFTNNAPFPVSVVNFTPPGILPDSGPIAANGGTWTSPAGPADVTLNYSVDTGSNRQGPFGIQFGNGAFNIDLRNEFPNPWIAAIPQNGYATFTSLDFSYQIDMTPSNAFQPYPIPVVTLGNPQRVRAVPGYSGLAQFNVTKKSDAATSARHKRRRRGFGGGGTIKVGSG